MEEEFMKSINNIELYNCNKKLLAKNSRQFTEKVNELTFNEERLEVLKRVKNALETQNPLKDNCPTCRQGLPSSLEDIYRYFQDKNDTDINIDLTKKKIEQLKREVEKLKKQQEKLKIENLKYYNILKDNGILD